MSNKIQNLMRKQRLIKRTENGDIAYTTTGDNLTDLFFMTPYFEKHLDQVHIGQSDKEKLFAMFVRDPRYGLGRRDLGRELMYQANVSTRNVVKAGRVDDLWHIARDEDLKWLRDSVFESDLVKKWMPRLTSKDKLVAKYLCKMWGLSEKEYRQLIKTKSTTEYKLSYAVKAPNTNLEKLFGKDNYLHPLVDDIKFEQVPSLAMKKYLRTFSIREDLKDRFNLYMQDVRNDKKKINVSTTNVVDAKDVVMGDWTTQDYKENQDILGKKIVEKATIGVEMDAIVILDTSGSMGSYFNKNSLLRRAMSIAHGITINNTYAKNQLISFSNEPRLMTIRGETLEDQYRSMYTGDCSNTDFGKVMKLLSKLNKFPKYFIVISDMEFDWGSNNSKEETMRIIKSYGANTKIVWWNLSDRNKTVPEFDEYGNIFLSGYNLQILKLLENDFNMTTYIDKVLEEYKRKINEIVVDFAK